MPNQITVNTDNSQINIDEGGTRVITIVGAGPQGPTGPVGPQGPSGSVGDSGSLLITASIDSSIITFEKGDGSTFDIEVNNVTSSISSSYALTASYLSGYIEPFPYTGSAEITGSLGVTGSITSTQLGVGAEPSGSTRLDVRAQGALSTDIVFRVRNSINTLNFAQFNGDGTYLLSTTGNSTTDAFSRILDGRMFMAKSGQNFIELNPGVTTNRLYAPSNGWALFGNTTISTEAVPNSGGSGTWQFFAGTLQIGGLVATQGANNSIWISNGVAPTINYQNRHWYYSADITAGNAAPHFRTEDGSIIKLYQQPSVTSSQGIADVLTNVGLLSGVSVIESTFPYTGSAIISGSLTVTGSTDISGSLTASSLTTPQGTINQLTSSYAITASHALNAGGGSGFPFVGDAVITGSLTVSSSNNTSSLTLYGSGSNPVFIVQGSAGELFSISDSLSGSLFSVHNEFGLPILETFSDNQTLIGNYIARSLYTTAVITSTTSSVTQSVYSVSTSSYDGAFFEYTVTSASNARAGNIMAIWNGGSVEFNESTTSDIGSTSDVLLSVEISASRAHLLSKTNSDSWKIKTIVRSI